MLCPRCGAPATPADKFCAICASPLGASGPGAFGAPPPPPPPPPFGAPPGFGPPPEPPAFGPPGGFGPPPPGGFGPPPEPPAFGPPGGFGPPPPPPGGFGPPPPPPGGFGPPDFGSPGGGFGPPGGGFGPPPPPPPGGGFGPPPPPPPGGGFGPPPPPPPFGPPPEPPGFGPPGGGFGSPGGFGPPPPPPGYPDAGGGGYPPPAPQQGYGPPDMPPDAFGATAYASPTGAMSGYGGEQPAYAAPAPPPPPPPAPPAPQMKSTGPNAGMSAPAGAKDRRPLAGFLISFQDDPLGKFWPLWQGKNLVGRAETGQKVDVEIAHGTTSTHHATVECDGGRIVLSDLGSTNGTFHNEEAIGFQGKRDLRDGDRIRFGGFSVLVINVASRN